MKKSYSHRQMFHFLRISLKMYKNIQFSKFISLLYFYDLLNSNLFGIAQIKV